jgi:hypothetical protein
MGQTRLGDQRALSGMLNAKPDTIFSKSDLFTGMFLNSGIHKEGSESPVVGIRNLAP